MLWTVLPISGSLGPTMAATDNPPRNMGSTTISPHLPQLVHLGPCVALQLVSLCYS